MAELVQVIARGAACDARGWRQVEALRLGLHRLWIPYRVVKSVDEREMMVTLTKTGMDLVKLLGSDIE